MKKNRIKIEKRKKRGPRKSMKFNKDEIEQEKRTTIHK